MDPAAHGMGVSGPEQSPSSNLGGRSAIGYLEQGSGTLAGIGFRVMVAHLFEFATLMWAQFQSKWGWHLSLCHLLVWIVGELVTIVYSVMINLLMFIS
jgi:hypothetical protein